MIQLTSFKNKIVKRIVKLRERKFRDEYGEYVVEGVRWIDDALNRCCTPDILSVLLIKESVLSDIWQKWQLKISESTVFSVTDAVFEKLTDTENSQGVLAVFKKILPQGEPQSNRILLLDRVRDPGNMGTILRTACAAGYSDILCMDCVDVYNPKVIRSCMTGILHTRIFEDFLPQELKQMGYTLVAADLKGVNLYDYLPPSGKLCLVIGNEANGISPYLSSLCNESVTIPMKNIESLNAAVSAGILMYWLNKK